MLGEEDHALSLSEEGEVPTPTSIASTENLCQLLAVRLALLDMTEPDPSQPGLSSMGGIFVQADMELLAHNIVQAAAQIPGQDQKKLTPNVYIKSPADFAGTGRNIKSFLAQMLYYFKVVGINDFNDFRKIAIMVEKMNKGAGATWRATYL